MHAFVSITLLLCKQSICPLHKVLDIRQISVPAVVLSPGKFTFQQANVDRRHLLGQIVVRASEITTTQQTVCWLSCDDRHEAALLIKP